MRRMAGLVSLVTVPENPKKATTEADKTIRAPATSRAIGLLAPATRRGRATSSRPPPNTSPTHIGAMRKRHVSSGAGGSPTPYANSRSKYEGAAARATPAKKESTRRAAIMTANVMLTPTCGVRAANAAANESCLCGVRWASDPWQSGSGRGLYGFSARRSYRHTRQTPQAKSPRRSRPRRLRAAASAAHPTRYRLFKFRYTVALLIPSRCAASLTFPWASSTALRIRAVSTSRSGSGRS
jgi:hypothetical protein